MVNPFKIQDFETPATACVNCSIAGKDNQLHIYYS